MLTVLGIDPGTRIMGWCVISGDSRRQSFVDGGTVRVGGGQRHCVEAVFRSISGLIRRFGPEIVALESPFYGKNAKTLIRLGEVRGAVILAATTGGATVVDVSPSEAKLALTGVGNATKEQVAYMVRTLLSLGSVLPPDASDAAAVAIAALRRTQREKGCENL